MGIIIGIDIGGSTTKIVGFQGERFLSPLFVKSSDPVASLFGAFGKFTCENGIAIQDIEQIVITGVGASYVRGPIYGIPTSRTEEFLCIGLGGLYLSGLEKAIVVSMGTGTALVSAGAEQIVHMGGTGVGGGTLLGLSKQMIGLNQLDNILKLAAEGDLENIDLSIGELTNEQMPQLEAHLTASNFGKMSETAENADIALGIVNLVFQTIGMMAVFASRIEGNREIVLTGNLSNVSIGRPIFDILSQKYQVTFLKPENSEYATATGAALAYRKKKPMEPVEKRLEQ